MKYELGVEVRDIITGFKGIATGYVKYLTGCDQYLISPPVDKEGKIVDPQWYDVNRVEAVDGGKRVAVETSVDKGPDRPAPVK